MTIKKYAKDLELLKNEYSKLKKDFEKQKDSETLKKYKILSRAYAIGKILEGQAFSVKKLSLDFDIPHTTVKRVLSLDRMTSKTKRLMNAGKISAFKVAQICSTKNRLFQDEIVDLVIKGDLSTYDIKKLKVRNTNDVKKYKLEKSIKLGFARKDSAYRSFVNLAERMTAILQTKITDYPENKKNEIKNILVKLQVEIIRFIEGNELDRKK